MSELANSTLANSLPGTFAPGAKWPGNLLLRKYIGAAKVPGNEMARERKGQGAKGPGIELARVLLADSLLGANWPVNENARYHDTVIETSIFAA